MSHLLLKESQLTREVVGGELYEYYPLGKYIVRARGICGGRPTFKYTRIEVALILKRIAQGKSVEYIVNAYHDPHLTEASIQEAIALATSAFSASPQVALPLSG
jgi:uncharacterized protein (DUF433 family)